MTTYRGKRAAVPVNARSRDGSGEIDTDNLGAKRAGKWPN
jgi:hypothetical protein